MKVGIVGSEATKFTQKGEASARELIDWILGYPDVDEVVSGHCHLGGIDIWAEEIADKYSIKKVIFPPRSLSWDAGYKPRNLQIAHNSDIVHCITVKQLPKDYQGMRFLYCYHCKVEGHIKSGGCWTMKKAIEMGKQGKLHVIENY
jgi:hypothetical protein